MRTGTVSVRDVSKRYRRTSGFRDRRRLDHAGRGAVWGLRDVSVEVAPGEMLGLVGSNGSGKSTLLRLIAGITAPTKGTIETNGRVAGILTLGDGFHPLFTGRENALTGALLAGMTRREAELALDRILEFSELGAAANDPMRTYSSGMVVRLAYSVAAHVAADILLVDEALAVGDLSFSTKCLAHMDALRAGGTTILLASHDLTSLTERCDRAAWIADGRLMALGEPAVVVDRYEEASHADTVARTPEHRREAGRLGAGEIGATIASLTTRDGLPATTLRSGWPLAVELDLHRQEAVDSLVVGVSIHGEHGESHIDLSTELPPTFGSDGRRRVRLDIDRLDLTDGRYHVAIGTYPRGFERAYDYCWEAAWITVTGNPTSGVVAPPHRWSVPVPPA